MLQHLYLEALGMCALPMYSLHNFHGLQLHTDSRSTYRGVLYARTLVQCSGPTRIAEP